MTDNERVCCYVYGEFGEGACMGCGDDAEFAILGTTAPQVEDELDACTLHVGELLLDASDGRQNTSWQVVRLDQ